MPIVMSKEEWERLQRWTVVDREDPEIVRRRDYIRFLDETSTQMTKSWPNSLENVNKRNEELRRARIEAAEQANSKFYKRHVRKEREKQKRLMNSARDMIFKNKDAPKLLLSAVIETVIQKERIEQVKFNNELRRMKAEQKKTEDDEIIRKAKEWEELNELKKKRRFEASKRHQKEILDQANEAAERNRIDYETELKMQKMDNIKANEQMDAIKEFEENFQAAEKARILADMQQARGEAAARRSEQAARDAMDDKLIQVLNNSYARINQKRLQTERDVKNEKMRVLESISAKLESGDATRNAKEEEMLNKAIKEKDAVLEAQRMAEVRKREHFRQQRLESRELFLREEARRLHEFNNTRQWEIMNRFKNAELYDDFKEKQRHEKERKIKEHREEILRLWRERQEREAREAAETRQFYGPQAEAKLRDADRALLHHAALLLDEAAQHGRPTHALHKAIDRYCKMYRLYPMPPLPASLQEHFTRYRPWDGSRPGPPPPAPPAPASPPPAPAVALPPVAGGGKADGLQEPAQGTVSKKDSNTTEESVEDYKRKGKANGLQRRNAQVDLTLPPITVVPCQTESCRCDFNK